MTDPCYETVWDPAGHLGRLILDKYTPLAISEASRLPPSRKAIVLIAGLGVVGHPLMVVSKASWGAYVSMDVLTLAIAILLATLTKRDFKNKDRK